MPETNKVPPTPDRLTVALRASLRSEYETARAARHALLALRAPLWRRLLALLPDTQAPLRNWVEVEKTKLQNRL